MQIVIDSRPDDVLRLEHLLEGHNYTVWINTYGPLGINQTLEEALRGSVSKDCVVGNATSVSVEDARSQVLELLLHTGDGGYGPLDLLTKRSEILSLAEALFQSVNLDQAENVTSFWFAKGHPAYPVFWDFAFDIHTLGQRWILMGSSSD
ncbi:hypothetical protein [Pseudomonas fluorescens]|uniref:hypothetical protein n=1 Tax=Pseudomonas fluorescens TaxID=294 RepID=UPI000A8AA306|nr:hypothetical protein [Pseudomonas fluorescens]